MAQICSAIEPVAHYRATEGTAGQRSTTTNVGARLVKGGQAASLSMGGSMQGLLFHRTGPCRIKGTVGFASFAETVDAGSLHLIPPNADVELRLLDSVQTMQLSVKMPLLRQAATEARILQFGPIELPHTVLPPDPQLTALLEAVAQAIEQGGPDTVFFVEHTTRLVLSLLMHRLFDCNRLAGHQLDVVNSEDYEILPPLWNISRETCPSIFRATTLVRRRDLRWG